MRRHTVQLRSRQHEFDSRLESLCRFCTPLSIQCFPVTTLLSYPNKKSNKFDAVSFIVCGSDSWLGSFIAGTAPSFSIKLCKSSAKLGLVYKKHSSSKTMGTNKHTYNTPEIQTASTVHVTLGSFPSHPKTHSFLETFFLSQSCAALPMTLMDVLLLSLWLCADVMEGHARK